MSYFTRQHIEKAQKKAKLIFDLYKTGKYKIELEHMDIQYKYVLPDEYYVSIDDVLGTPIIVLTMNPTQQLELYTIIKTNNENFVEEPVNREYKSLYRGAKDRIIRKFEKHNIELIF